MESYYTNQASALPYFACIASLHYRQRCSGFGALASGIEKIVLPLAKKFLIPAKNFKNFKKTKASLKHF